MIIFINGKDHGEGFEALFLQINGVNTGYTLLPSVGMVYEVTNDDGCLVKYKMISVVIKTDGSMDLEVEKVE